MRVFLAVPARRGVVVAIAVAVALPLAYGGRWDMWLGLWGETQNNIGVSSIFALPVAAAAGAFIGTMNARNGMDQLGQLSARRSFVVNARNFGETASWAVLGYIVGALPAFVLTAAAAVNNRPTFLPFLAQAAAIVAFTMLGQLLGPKVPWFLGAPVAAGLVYGVLGFLSFNADTVLIALTPINERSGPFERPLPWVLMAQSGLWFAVAVAIVLRSSAKPRAAAAAAFLAALVASPLLYVTPDTQETDNDSLVMNCDGQGPVLCLPQAKEILRAQLTPNLMAASKNLAGLLGPEPVFLDDEAQGSSAAADRSIEAVRSRYDASGVDLIPFSLAGDLSSYARPDRNGIHYSLIAYLAPPSETSTDLANEQSSDPRFLATTTDVIWRWYLDAVRAPTGPSGGIGAPYLSEKFVNYKDHGSSIRAFDDMTTQERAAWFAENRQQIRSGKLSWSRFDQTLP